MFKNLLLSGTALVGLAVMSAPAQAGTVGSGDNLSIELSGEYRFNAAVFDQDISATRGRGYRFNSDESELKIKASNTAANGINYGVNIEMNAGTDDSTAADEANAFISGNWGHIDLGDQDDATDRMFVEANSVMVGRAGFDDDVEDHFNFGSGGAIAAPGNDATSDATKVTYFTPRFSGFQLGASLTPDSGSNGFSRDADNDGDYENVLGLGVNYAGTFDVVTLTLSATGEFGSSETATGAATEGDLQTISVGGTVAIDKFSFGAGYVDFGDKGQSQANIALGADSGHYWDAAVAYSPGPWAVSVGYFESEKSQPTGSGGDSTVKIVSLDGEYKVAPGWTTALSVNFVDAGNINGTATEVNNKGTVVVLANTFNF